MDALPGYRAVREGVGLLEPAPPGPEVPPSLHPRGMLQVTGPDAVSFLHRILTQDIAGIAPGSGAAACLADRMGKVLAPAFVWRDAAELWIETDPGREALLAKKLSMYALGSRAELIPWGTRLTRFGLRGPGTEGLAAALGLPPPAAPAPSSALVGGVRIHRVEDPIGPALDLWVPAAEAAAWRERLLAGGAVAVEAGSAEALRVEAGRAVFGVDYDEGAMPIEVGLWGAVARDKGCYVGQEILERLFSRGVVTRLLRIVKLEGREAPAPGTPVVKGGAELGRLTSARFSPRAGAVIGLASLPAAKAEPGDGITVAGAPGVVCAAPLA